MRLQETTFKDEFHDFDGMVSEWSYLVPTGRLFYWGRLTKIPGKEKKGFVELFSTKKERDVDNAPSKQSLKIHPKIYSKSDLSAKDQEGGFHRNFKLKFPLVSIRDQRKTRVFRVLK